MNGGTDFRWHPEPATARRLTTRAASWKRLSGWSERIAQVIPAGCADECRRFWKDDRYRVEVLIDRGSIIDLRFPCRHGEINPVGSGKWSWSGPGGHWTRKVIGVLGEDAAGPWGAQSEAGTRNDEAVIWFPAEHLPKVAETVGARHRAHAGNLANLAGAA